MDNLLKATLIDKDSAITPVSSVTSGPDELSLLSSPFESPEIVKRIDDDHKQESGSVGSFQIESTDSIMSISNETGEADAKYENDQSAQTLSNNEDAPAIDPHALQDLETHARRISDQVYHMMALLKSNSFKALYALIAKSEEVSKELSTALTIRDQVNPHRNDIKRILDQMETVVMKEVVKKS